MAQLPRHRTKHLATRIVSRRVAPFLLLALLLPGRAAAPIAPIAPLDLVGTWHVLIHYTDANTSRPDQLRWSDRVWVFEMKGSRLSWIEYPIVVFSNESGRFERRQAGLARVLGAWEPSEAQLANISSGLKINNRGQKKKTLRGSDAGGWKSTGRARPGSASIITFEENWSIQGLLDLPRFEQLDVMGSGLSETMEGATRWETTKVDEGGGVLRGSFDRDGSRKGRFIMRRSGAVGQLEKRSQKEIQEAGFRRGVASSSVVRNETKKQLDIILKESAVRLEDDEKEQLVTDMINVALQGRSRAEAAQLVRQKLTAQRVKQGIQQEIDVRGLKMNAAQVDALTAEVVSLLASGMPEEEIPNAIRDRLQGRSPP